MVLQTEQNTPSMYKKVLRVARRRFGRNVQADFEHGQWWITVLGTGAQYSVVDCQTPGGIDYLDFEQVSYGDTER